MSGAARELFEERREAARLSEADREDEAVRLLESIVGRHLDERDPGVAKQKALAIGQLGSRYRLQERHDVALGMYEQALARLDVGSEEWVQVLYFVADSLRKVGRASDAVVALDRFLGCVGPESPEALRTLAAGGLVAKAELCDRMERHDEALAAFDVLLDRFGSIREGRIPVVVVDGLEQRTNLLERLGRLDEAARAAATYVEHVERAHGEGSLWALAARADRAEMLAKLDRFDEALSELDPVTRALGGRSDLVSRRTFVFAMGQKASAEMNAGDLTGAMATLDELMARDVDVADPALDDRIAEAWLVRLSVALRVDRDDDAAECAHHFKNMLRRQPDVAATVAIGAWVVHAQYRCHRSGRFGLSLELCRCIEEELTFLDDPAARTMAAGAVLSAAACLGELGRPEAARAERERVLEFGEAALEPLTDIALQTVDADDPPKRAEHAFTVLARITILGEAEHHADALMLIDDYLDRHGTDADAPPGVAAALDETRRELRRQLDIEEN